MKVNRRQFVGLLYDSILFEYASHVGVDQHHILALADLADTFAFVADFYKHNRPLMDIPCDQFITRNQLHTVIGLLDYIEELDRGVFEIFPRNVEIREDAPSFASSSSMKRDRRKQQQESSSGHGHGHQQERERGIKRSRSALDMFVQAQRGWSTTDIYDHRGHDIHHQDPDTDLDDEYSIAIPGLSKTDIQTFLWEYAYMPEEYQDDIATLIRYLRRDEWMMNGSKGPIVAFDWGLEGVQKFTKEYNQNKIHKVEIREQEEVKRAQEATQMLQEEWSRQQELAREQEAAKRIKTTDDFIWRMHKSLVISAGDTTAIEDLIKTLEAEISEYFDFCFLALVPVGSFATGSHTRYSDLDLTLTGNTKTIAIPALADALRHFNYEGVTISIPRTQQPIQPSTSITPSSTSAIPLILQPFITFIDPKTEMTCHISLNDPLAIYRSKLVYTYNMAEPRFCPVFLALKRLAVQRHLISGSVHQDRHRPMPLGSYALALMLITFLQTENPPLLPKLQQQTPSSLEEEERDERERPVKETIVQGIDCSFDRDWKYHRGLGSGNSKGVAELLMDFCRFFGYVFDYESKEVNARIGAFRWRPDVSSKTAGASNSQVSSSSLITVFSSMGINSGPTSSSSSSSYSQSNPPTSSSSSVPKEFKPVTLHVMDPFVMGLNITSACQGDQVRMVKECFQEVYEALNEGDINHVFSSS